MRTLIAIFTFAGIAPFWFAQATPTPKGSGFVAYAPGTASCGSWTEARINHRQADNDVRFYQFEAYMYGYASAYNQLSNKTINVMGKTDADGAYGFIDKYCADRPTETFVAAVIALLRHLQE